MKIPYQFKVYSYRNLVVVTDDGLGSFITDENGTERYHLSYGVKEYSYSIVSFHDPFLLDTDGTERYHFSSLFTEYR